MKILNYKPPDKAYRHQVHWPLLMSFPNLHPVLGTWAFLQPSDATSLDCCRLTALHLLILLHPPISLWSVRSPLKCHHCYLDHRDLPSQCLSTPLSSCISVTLWNLFTCLLISPPSLGYLPKNKDLVFSCSSLKLPRLSTETGNRRCSGNVYGINE